MLISSHKQNKTEGRKLCTKITFVKLIITSAKYIPVWWSPFPLQQYLNVTTDLAFW